MMDWWRSDRGRTWFTWRDMRRRCENPKSPDYPNYGGRGISVCDRWQSLENFIADMGYRPDGLTLERKDNDGNYEPSNCKWATLSEQQRNKRFIRRGGVGVSTYQGNRSRPYRAYIYERVDGASKQIHIGTFATEREAREAAAEARQERGT